MARLTLDAAFVAADVRAAIDEWVTHAEQWVGDLSSGDFVLLVLAAVLVWWVIASLRAVTRIGPIQLDVVTHDGPTDDAPEVQALTTLLRERLAHSGLTPPPQVPAGTPQTDLITAIEASNIPQSAWLAKLLQLLPKPPQPPRYQLSATLLGAEPPSFSPIGIRFWLRPTREGTPLLSTARAPDYTAAVDRAAAEIFVHISNEAAHVFPTWARWRDPRACEAYVDGISAQRRHDLESAHDRFAAADKIEPTNALARLQLANLDELKALDRPAQQASVLRRYLDLAMERTELVEPRYRASVLAGVIASAIKPAPAPGQEAQRAAMVSDVAVALRVVSPISSGGLTTLLEALAARESEATFALLQPWYVLVSRRRPRHRFELQGFARRRLMTTVRISRHSLAVRRVATVDTPREAFEDRGRRFLVRVVHLWLGRPFCGWQAFYNAGCFYALLAQHRSGEQARRLRGRAYRCLEHAAEEAGAQLPAKWMIESDPGLTSLRDAQEARWSLLARRVLGQEVVLSGYPASPWIAPRARRYAWSSVAVLLGLTFAASLAAWVLAGWLSWPAQLALLGAAGAGAAYAWYRAGRAARETEFHRLPSEAPAG
ncbi:MAG TPA: hypothetical protein VK501_13570 [Baekduia sp.]|uniref:hypothetical protein n=1 Tax=Baekduia sp. TaxID=2600305 RepID=UPI002B7C9FA9|nr:hypothetical protein [Baekduia sp.]HMJ34936.1 hypothetical protein [Baekduia sp.]